MLLDELHSYRNPRDKLARMVQNKECIPIIQGLYETDSSTPGYRLANCICTPSYLSFEFALSYHGLIPEAVYNFTSATFEKLNGRSKALNVRSMSLNGDSKSMNEDFN